MRENQVLVRLTRDEYRRLKECADAEQRTLATFVRLRALRSLGIM